MQPFFRGSLSDICIAPRSIWGPLFLSDPWFFCFLFFREQLQSVCRPSVSIFFWFHSSEVVVCLFFSRPDLKPYSEDPKQLMVTGSGDDSQLGCISSPGRLYIVRKSGTSSTTIKSLNQATLASHRYGMVGPRVWSSEVLFVVGTTLTFTCFSLIMTKRQDMTERGGAGFSVIPVRSFLHHGVY